jgi:8-oxo-dGTP pyrophosphatase MutT (NUDIX family)
MKVEKSGAVIRKKIDGNWHILLVCLIETDYWNIPKGHIDPGETKEETLEREMDEEIGCKVNVIKPLPEVEYNDGNGDDMIMYTYLCEIENGEPRPESPEYKLEWIPVSEIIETLSYPEMKEFIAKVMPEIIQ